MCGWWQGCPPVVEQKGETMLEILKRARESRVVALSAAGLVVVLLATLFLVFWNEKLLNNQISEVSRVVNHMAMLTANDADATRALALGREAIQKGEWNLGQIFLVNAVTNAPRNLSNLEAYATCILGRDDAPIDALDRVSLVLQLSAYQVDSADVPAVLALIEKAEQSRKRSLQGSEKGGKEQALDLAGQWDKLSKVDIGIWKDPTKLTAHQKSLEDFISTLDEQDEPIVELRSKAAEELVRWTEITQAVRQCAYVDACLGRLGKGEDLASQRAVAIIQAAENALPGFWGINVTVLPPELKGKIDQYPESVQARVKQIGNARSVSLLKQIHEALTGDAAPSEGQKWQAKSEAIERKLRDAQHLATQLTSTDALAEAQKLMEKRSEDLKSCRNNQYYEYQSFVVTKCNALFKDYMTFKLGLSEQDARDLFKKHFLAEVNQSLLSPEVSRIFNDLLGKLMVEMGAQTLVKTESEMGTMAKRKLEDF
jgi:hypothetical protein